MPLLVTLAVLGGCAGGSAQSPPPGEASAAGEATTGTTGKSLQEVEKMGLREAVGQMFVVSVGGAEPDRYVEEMVRERNVGGVLLFGRNMRSEAQTRSLVEALQELALGTDPAVPLFVAVDHEGGEVQHAPWVTPRPSAAELGAGGKPETAEAVARQMGIELRRAGVNTDFAPVVDTGHGAAIGSRSFGEDPLLVARMGAAAVEGFEAAGVVSAAKHFPNHGPATEDSHVGLPVVDHDQAAVFSYDLPPFRAAVEAGVPMVMVGHLVYPAVDPERPASLSPAAMSLLRERLGFEGVIVTDDLAMAGATGASAGSSPARAAVEAVRAGADLLVLSSPYPEQVEAYEAVVAAVESGEIPRGRVEEAAGRVAEVKERYDLRRPGCADDRGSV